MMMMVVVILSIVILVFPFRVETATIRSSSSSSSMSELSSLPEPIPTTTTTTTTRTAMMMKQSMPFERNGSKVIKLFSSQTFFDFNDRKILNKSSHIDYGDINSIDVDKLSTISNQSNFSNQINVIFNEFYPNRTGNDSFDRDDVDDDNLLMDRSKRNSLFGRKRSRIINGGFLGKNLINNSLWQHYLEPIEANPNYWIADRFHDNFVCLLASFSGTIRVRPANKTFHGGTFNVSPEESQGRRSNCERSSKNIFWKFSQQEERKILITTDNDDQMEKITEFDPTGQQIDLVERIVSDNNGALSIDDDQSIKLNSDDELYGEVDDYFDNIYDDDYYNGSNDHNNLKQNQTDRLESYDDNDGDGDDHLDEEFNDKNRKNRFKKSKLPNQTDRRKTFSKDSRQSPPSSSSSSLLSAKTKTTTSKTMITSKISRKQRKTSIIIERSDRLLSAGFHVVGSVIEFHVAYIECLQMIDENDDDVFGHQQSNQQQQQRQQSISRSFRMRNSDVCTNLSVSFDLGTFGNPQAYECNHIWSKTLKDIHYNHERRHYNGEIQISLNHVRIDKDPLGVAPYSFRRVRIKCVWDSILSWQSLSVMGSLLLIFIVGFFCLCVCSNSSCSSDDGDEFTLSQNDNFTENNNDCCGGRVCWLLWCCSCFIYCCPCCRNLRGRQRGRRRSSSPNLIQYTSTMVNSNRNECNHTDHHHHHHHHHRHRDRRRGPPPPPPPPSSSTSLLTTTSSHLNQIGGNGGLRKHQTFSTSYSYDGTNGSNPTQQSFSSAMSTAVDNHFDHRMHSVSKHYHHFHPYWLKTGKRREESQFVHRIDCLSIVGHDQKIDSKEIPFNRNRFESDHIFTSTRASKTPTKTSLKTISPMLILTNDSLNQSKNLIAFVWRLTQTIVLKWWLTFCSVLIDSIVIVLFDRFESGLINRNFSIINHHSHRNNQSKYCSSSQTRFNFDGRILNATSDPIQSSSPPPSSKSSSSSSLKQTNR